CDGYTEPFFVDLNVIEVIATHLAGGCINPAYLKSVNGGSFGWKQDTLNIPRNLEIVIESLLFVRHGINDGVVERKSGLFGDRFENDEVSLRKGWARRALRQRQNAQVLVSIPK